MLAIPLLAALEFSDFAIIAAIVLVIAGGSAAWGARTPASEQTVLRLESKLNLIMKHLGIERPDPSSALGLSEEVRRLADNPTLKIQAIKLHREQTGASLKEAKDAIEAYMNGQH